MAKSLMSRRKANGIASGIFLVAIAIIIYNNAWWPGILIAIWAMLATRQYLTGRIYDLTLSTVILLGIATSYSFQVGWEVLIPVLLTIGGIYIVIREYYFTDDPKGEDIPQELEDDADIGE